MNECRRFRRNLEAYWREEMDEHDRKTVKRHLDNCPDCAGEFMALEKVLEGADSLGREMRSALAGIDWDSQAEKIVASIWDQRPRARREEMRTRLWKGVPRFRPAFAGLLLGIMVGAVGMFIAHRGGLFEKPKGEALFASREFLDRVDQEIARRETLAYLDKSQFVLLELAQAQTGSGDCRLTDAAARETRELLAKKKYLNPQLEKVRMAKAKDICDQIEMLFFELAQVSEGLTPAQCLGIQEMIEEKNILLKIKLLKKELQENEV